MSRQWKRAIIASLMMILSSLAGCIGDEVETDEEEEVVDPQEPVVETGTVMVSTYHVEQLVSAVAGDLLTVEMMSTSNIPVHDYTPTGQDLIRLQTLTCSFTTALVSSLGSKTLLPPWATMHRFRLPPTPCQTVLNLSTTSR